MTATLSSPIYQGQTVVVSYDSRLPAATPSGTPPATSWPPSPPARTACRRWSTIPRSWRRRRTSPATAGDAQVTLNWDVPASKLGVTHHDYRFKTDGSYEDWDRDREQRAGRGQRGQLHGAEPHQRHGLHLPAPPRTAIPRDRGGVERGDADRRHCADAQQCGGRGRRRHYHRTHFQRGFAPITGDSANCDCQRLHGKVDGVERNIVSIVGNTGSRMTATLSSPIYQGQTVVVSYDKSVAGSDAIGDAAGNELASFTTGEAGAGGGSTVVGPAGRRIRGRDAPRVAEDFEQRPGRGGDRGTSPTTRPTPSSSARRTPTATARRRPRSR